MRVCNDNLGKKTIVTERGSQPSERQTDEVLLLMFADET